MATTVPSRRPLGLPRDRCGSLALRRDRVRLRTVMVDGQTIGRIADVILDGRARRVAGFAVACADGERFLPLAAVAAVGPSGIEIESGLHLVDEIDFYRRDGVALSTVLGRAQSGGHVEDVIARLDTGDVEALVLDSGARVAP
jgi:sporulation protein YlmC with PRC-barrel domain